MIKLKYVCLVFLLSASVTGCLTGGYSNLPIMAEGMALDEFLSINGLSYESATERLDTNDDGNINIYTWDLDGDEKADVIIELNEDTRVTEHGITYGFHKIIILDYSAGYATIADVGKNSGKIQRITSAPFTETETP